ncbi:UNVERIFIED_CONTAM: hypothetical protein HDU68_009911 [Siphonaria sp. JEL0065]|nr:hypothetical protein HDU68_009911 [Siphonaria sp. JEL0065]
MEVLLLGSLANQANSQLEYKPLPPVPSTQIAPNAVTPLICPITPIFTTISQYYTITSTIPVTKTVIQQVTSTITQSFTSTFTVTITSTTTKPRKCKPKTAGPAISGSGVGETTASTCGIAHSQAVGPKEGNAIQKGIQPDNAPQITLSTIDVVSTMVPHPLVQPALTVAVSSTTTRDPPQPVALSSTIKSSVPEPQPSPIPAPPPPFATSYESRSVTQLLSWHWFNTPTLDCSSSIQPFEYNSGYYAGSENGLQHCGSKATFTYNGNSVQVTIGWKTTGGVNYYELSAQAFGDLIGSKETVKKGMVATDWQLLINDPGKVTGTCVGTC